MKEDNKNNLLIEQIKKVGEHAHSILSEWDSFTVTVNTEYGTRTDLDIDKIRESGKYDRFQFDSKMYSELTIGSAILEETARELGIIKDAAVYGSDPDSMVEFYEKRFGDDMTGCIFDYANTTAIGDPRYENRQTHVSVLGEPLLDEKGQPVNVFGMSIRDQVELYRSELKKQFGLEKTRGMQ